MNNGGFARTLPLVGCKDGVGNNGGRDGGLELDTTRSCFEKSLPARLWNLTSAILSSNNCAKPILEPTSAVYKLALSTSIILLILSVW